MRGLKESNNTTCADCGLQDNTWASVSHGVFICVICSDVHRSVGTHVTKVKGCTGTYLWGPDELEKMRTMGNRHGDEVYGSEKVNPDASKEQKQRFVVEKYEKRSFVGKPMPAKTALPNPRDVRADQQQPDKPVVREAERTESAGNAPIVAPETPSQQAFASASHIPDAFFDDFFNEAENSYFGNLSVPVKSSKPDIVVLAPPASSDTDHNLDAFLNSTLHASTQPAPVTMSAYPARLDPFADWPEF